MPKKWWGQTFISGSPSNEWDLTYLLRVLGSSSHETRGPHAHPGKRILSCKIHSWFVAEGICPWLSWPVLPRQSAPSSSTCHFIFRRGLISGTGFQKPLSTWKAGSEYAMLHTANVIVLGDTVGPGHLSYNLCHLLFPLLAVEVLRGLRRRLFLES